MAASIIDSLVTNENLPEGLWDVLRGHLIGASPFLDGIAADVRMSRDHAEEVHGYAIGNDETHPDYFEFSLTGDTSTPKRLRFRAALGPRQTCEYVEFVARNTARGWRVGATCNAPAGLPSWLV